MEISIIQIPIQNITKKVQNFVRNILIIQIFVLILFPKANKTATNLAKQFEKPKTEQTMKRIYETPASLYNKDFGLFQHRATVNALCNAIACGYQFECKRVAGKIQVVFAYGGHSYMVDVTPAELKKCITVGMTPDEE